MGWSGDYKENEIMADYTKSLRKIWDNLLPETYPYVIDFKTNKVVEVKQDKYIGPYSHNEHFIHYDCDLKLDNTPLIDAGWDGGEITSKLVKMAYGENYFDDLRYKLRELSKYAGLSFSNFDMGGNINTRVDELT